MSQNYPYHDYIKNPSQLKASTKGDLPTLEKNIQALQSYVGVLVSGHTNGNVGGGPLGNKYFMDTTGTCKDQNGAEQERYVYINNIPDGNIPFISSAMGQTMSQFEGLVPGILEDMSYIDPTKLFRAFSESTDCQQITMETKDISNNITTESKYVTNADIQDYNPCWFPNKKNPVTNVTCKEGMTNRHDVTLYFVGLGGLGVYLMYKLLQKRI
jgi:hypothetical protein